jgi:VanZ family protein
LEPGFPAISTMDARQSPLPLRAIALLVLAGYWLALVVGTHWPRPPELFGIGESDKFLHFSAYFGLAFLVCLNWALAWGMGWRHWLAIAAILAAFGAVDEITQIPVGRNCDLRDWFADVTGVAAGMAVFAVGWAIVLGVSRRPPSSPQ